MFSQLFRCSLWPGLEVLANASRFGYNWGPFSRDFIENTLSLIFLFGKKPLFLWLRQVGASPTGDTSPAKEALCFPSLGLSSCRPTLDASASGLLRCIL